MFEERLPFWGLFLFLGTNIELKRVFNLDVITNLYRCRRTDSINHLAIYNRESYLLSISSMNAYWLGTQTSDTPLVTLISKWNIQSVPNEEALKSILGIETDKTRHFLMELSEINEKKYLELKSMGERYGKKIKFIVFYQTLKPAPAINKLHGSEILLIGPQERNITNILLKRFFNNSEPMFRRWERFQVLTSGTLSLLSGESETVKVNVSHFSAHGARIEMVSDSFKKKDFVVLDYTSHDGKKIRMQARMAWTQARDSSWVGGLQFISRVV